MDWFEITKIEMIGMFATGVGVYFALLILIKINGLRTLSKMSAHDFAVTIALGSIMGAAVSQKDPTMGQGIFAFATLIFLQFLYSLWRMKRPRSYIENSPLLIMENGKIIYEALKMTRLTEDDVIAKLREANVLQLQDVRAVVLEATGDVSVLHGTKDPEDYLLKDVVRLHS